MDEYEVEILVRGQFPSELKPQLTKEIKIISEKLNAKDKGLSITTISITLEALSAGDAHYYAQKILEQFLAFYSVTTMAHMKMIVDQDNPIKVKKLTGKREIDEYCGIMFPDTSGFNPKLFVESILPHYPLINKIENEYLKIAMIHHLKATFEMFAEFRILNCIVALESLFSKKGETTEISYKISNRVATLLGKDNYHRIKLRKEIRDLYNYRSRIIHGDPIKLERQAFGGLFIWTADAIIRFITLASKYPDHDSIVDRIDDSMIDNSILVKLRDESNDLLDIIMPEKNRLLQEIFGENEKCSAG